MSPTTVKTLEAVQMTEAAENCALRVGAAEVAPVEVIVTPTPAANGTAPVPIRCTLMIWPAVKTDGGMVTILETVSLTVTSLEASAATKV